MRSSSSSHRLLPWCLALLALTPPAAAGAQEAEVRDAVEATLRAWSSGDFDSFASFYRDDARGFFLDGGSLLQAMDVDALRIGYEAGLRAELSLRDLQVAIFGETAVASGYLDGTLTLPTGAQMPGTWRYTETRIREGDSWRVVQYHFSTLTAARR